MDANVTRRVEGGDNSSRWGMEGNEWRCGVTWEGPLKTMRWNRVGWETVVVDNTGSSWVVYRVDSALRQSPGRQHSSSPLQSITWTISVMFIFSAFIFLSSCTCTPLRSSPLNPNELQSTPPSRKVLVYNHSSTPEPTAACSLSNQRTCDLTGYTSLSTSNPKKSGSLLRTMSKSYVSRPCSLFSHPNTLSHLR